MKRIYITGALYAFVLAISSCSLGDREVPLSELVDRGGRLFAIDEEVPFTGYAIEKHTFTGVIVSKFHYKDGVRHGPAFNWDVNGKLTLEANHKDGKAEGDYTEYYPNGRKKLHVVLIGGGREGIQTEWWDNGNMKQTTTYKNNLMVGEKTMWHESGEFFQKFLVEQK